MLRASEKRRTGESREWIILFEWKGEIVEDKQKGDKHSRGEGGGGGGENPSLIDNNIIKE